MNGKVGRAVLAGLFVATVLGWSSLLGSRIGWMVLLVTAVSVLAVWGLWALTQRAGDASAALRERLGRADAGHYHAFGGVRLRVEDDGRHVWIDGAGLQRVLGRREPDEAQAARHAGAWRRDERGVLMLRVDAVIQQLATMPGRNEPRIQKLRRYLERDVLFPARARRDVARPADR
ncbi:MAG: hypothetical protein C0505_05580 [Leptothrix sp. (in: Bacteria)]|nr:hypothetical protein [Leptothrix sp. (in: b-proteobacteria)]